MATLIIGESIGVSSTAGKFLLLALPIFILEPVMLSMTGGTIGHHLTGIKVTKQNGLGKINIVAATIRFVVKFLFGWFSFISVFATKKHQAIHDLVARSIVTHRDVSGLPQYDVLQEQKIEEDGFVYPSATRRALVILAYCILIFLLLAVMTGIVLSDDCLELERCSLAERSIEGVVNLAFLLLVSAVILFGCKSRLYGCRRRPVKQA
jgi:hypothetical protein